MTTWLQVGPITPPRVEGGKGGAGLDLCRQCPFEGHCKEAVAIGERIACETLDQESSMRQRRDSRHG